MRITWNLALDRRRRIRPDQMDDAFALSLAGRNTPADVALDEARELARVFREIDRLPRAERQVLLLSAIDELDTRELAQVLNKSESAIRALIFRARARLRERLDERRPVSKPERERTQRLNATPRRSIDHTIDRALSALRDAQPRSGSEMLAGRILASLEQRAATPQPARFHLSAHVALWTATSAAILAIASLMVLRHQTSARATNAVILSEASRSDAKSKNPEAAHPATNSEPFSTTNLAQSTNTVSSRPEPRSSAAKRSGETPVFRELPGAAQIRLPHS